MSHSIHPVLLSLTSGLDIPTENVVLTVIIEQHNEPLKQTLAHITTQRRSRQLPWDRQRIRMIQKTIYYPITVRISTNTPGCTNSLYVHGLRI